MSINANWQKQISMFLTAQTISLFGSSLVQYAIIWYITLTTLSGTMMTISTICGFLPQIMISLFAGVWIDRFDRKKIIMLSDAAIALATLAIAVSFLCGYKNIWLLFAALLVRSAGTGIQTPAVNAFIPQLVPQNKLMKINGIYSSITSLMMFLSPAASGAILSFTSIEATFFVDIITAIIGISILFVIKAQAYPQSPKIKTSGLDNLREGFAYLRHHSFIKYILCFQIIILILISPSAFLTPLMVSRSFGAEVWRLSLSEMTFSAGAVIGGILIASWGGFSNRIYTTILAACFYGLIMIGLGLAPIFLIYLFLNFLIGITMPIYNSPLNVLIQEKVEPYMHGRIFSFMQIATAGALPLGMVIFGPLADIVSIQSLLITCGLATIITALSFFYSKKLIAVVATPIP